MHAVKRLLPVQQEEVERFSRRFCRVCHSPNNMNCLGGAAFSPKPKLCRLDEWVHHFGNLCLDDPGQNFVEGVKNRDRS
eukprot:2870612-Karenia_brevis.AAC.1